MDGWVGDEGPSSSLSSPLSLSFSFIPFIYFVFLATSYTFGFTSSYSQRDFQPWSQSPFEEKHTMPLFGIFFFFSALGVFITKTKCFSDQDHVMSVILQ